MELDIILEKLSSEGLLKLHKISGNYYTCFCPLHNDGNERRPSFGILLREEVRNGVVYPKGFSHCFTCGFSGTLVELISEICKVRNLSSDGYSWIRQMFPDMEFESSDESDMLLPKQTVQQINNHFAIRYIQQLTRTETTGFVSEEELSSYRYTVPYMYERGLTDELIARYDIGVDMHFVPKGRKREVPSITFPVRDSKGNTLFISRRAIDKKAFYIPEDREKPVYGLYELPKNARIVMITESCFNALTAVKYGVPAVALLGTGTPYQMNQLKALGVREFVIGTDPDDAGDIAANKLRKNLHQVAIVRRMNGIPTGKDINDLDESTFLHLFNSRF